MRFSELFIMLAAASLIVLTVEVRADEPNAEAKKEVKSDEDQKEVKKKPKPKITVSKETTYIEGPLTDDGYVDYAEALNQYLSKGVTPQNNAAVPFSRALGSNGSEMRNMTDEFKKEFYKRLGIEAPPEKGDYLVSLADLADLLEVKVERVNDEQGRTTEGPWAKETLPTMARWIEVNEKPLALITEGAKRSRWYMPLVDEDEDTMIVALLLPTVQSARSVSRVLNARAMNRLHDGDVEGAWEDLMTIHRLGRHVAEGSTLIERLVGVALEGVACGGDRIVAQSGQLMTAQALKFRAQLEELPPVPRMADAINLAERYLMLDACVHLARQTPGAKEILDIDVDGAAEVLASLLSKTLIDWNEPMKMGNKWYDKLVAAGRLPTYLKQKAAMEKIDEELKKLVARAKDPKAFAIKFFLTGSPRKAVGRQIGTILISLLLPAVNATIEAENRIDLERAMTGVTLALAAYKNDHGRYPDSLDKLAPKYIAKIPLDSYVEKPLVYSTTPDGYLMYSVGRNQADEEGNGWWENRRDGDDLAVRFPRAKRSDE